MEEGRFSEGYLGGINKLLYMPLQALYACLYSPIKRMEIQFDQNMQRRKTLC
jgi:hypothetical protein